MDKPYCCFMGCKKDATKLIHYDGRPEGEAPYESYTHSCDEHTNELADGLKDPVIENL
jgi:hypothetical protein